MVFKAQAYGAAQIRTAEYGVAQHAQLVDIDGRTKIQPQLAVGVMADQIFCQSDHLLISKTCGWVRQLCFCQSCTL